MGVTALQEDFEAFYVRVKDDCLRALLLATGDRVLAEDLLSEAFARAWARWPAVRIHPRPEGWVMRTALNMNISWWRRRRRELLTSEPTDAAGRTDQGLGSEDLGGLAALVLTLPPRQRQVIALRVLLDLDTAETARVLGLAQGTVTAHLFRALQSLRRSLDSHQQQSTGGIA